MNGHYITRLTVANVKPIAFCVGRHWRNDGQIICCSSVIISVIINNVHTNRIIVSSLWYLDWNTHIWWNLYEWCPQLEAWQHKIEQGDEITWQIDNAYHSYMQTCLKVCINERKVVDTDNVFHRSAGDGRQANWLGLQPRTYLGVVFFHYSDHAARFSFSVYHQSHPFHHNTISRLGVHDVYCPFGLSCFHLVLFCYYRLPVVYTHRTHAPSVLVCVRWTASPSAAHTLGL